MSDDRVGGTDVDRHLTRTVPSPGRRAVSPRRALTRTLDEPRFGSGRARAGRGDAGAQWDAPNWNDFPLPKPGNPSDREILAGLNRQYSIATLVSELRQSK
jgi:hypothetical protein